MSRRGSRHKQFRCPPTLWDEAAEKAGDEKIKGGVSEVLRGFLTVWVSGRLPAPGVALAAVDDAQLLGDGYLQVSRGPDGSVSWRRLDPARVVLR